ncbi:MAG: cell division protein FtsW [Alphaproteobacteria bacterium]|nr:cell division protein FtsW [Alphaproteobacteria bacterium]
MMAVARSDTSIFGRWWWTVDRWMLLALLSLVAIGAVLVLAASPAVAKNIGAEPLHFVKRHLLLLGPAIAIMVGTSLLAPKDVNRLALLVFFVSLVLLALTLSTGVEIKGARRWLSIGGFSLQASEFAKVSLIVVSAWLFAEWRSNGNMAGWLIAFLLCAVTLGLIIKQPDLGTVLIVATAWLSQFFLAGLSGWLVAVLATAAVFGAVGAYFVFPHVASRVDRFLDPASGDSYQVDRSREAFVNGGLFGQGPAEGRIKALLPDAHADFIFAVIGEEMGLFACLIIVALFAFIVLRGFLRLLDERSLFVLLAVGGLLTVFGLQAFVNMASSLHLIPTKGMTLPLVSYGGSSLLALALAMGMVLALTRRRAETSSLP